MRVTSHSADKHRQMVPDYSKTAGTCVAAGFVTIGCCSCQRPPSFECAACFGSHDSTSAVRPYFPGLPFE
jgi:hypothetical protein